jgi:hypothetical protein
MVDVMAVHGVNSITNTTIWDAAIFFPLGSDHRQSSAELMKDTIKTKELPIVAIKAVVFGQSKQYLQPCSYQISYLKAFSLIKD